MTHENITVNGAPLKEHLDQQSAIEIAQVRDTEARPKRCYSRASKVRANTSRARTGVGAVVYTSGQKETHVIIMGEVWEWSAKAPFMMSGLGPLGALAYKSRTG